MFSADGEQARALASELDYDLVVLDLNLPRLDGVSILRHVRSKKPGLPILVLTARGRVDERVQCLDLGADDYLVKPFSFSRTFCTDSRIATKKPFVNTPRPDG
jgi:DNA-binding response OmpR family regulator